MGKQLLFDKYEVLKTLKQSADGAVYLANHTYLEKQIILKTLDTSVSDDAQKTNRFKQEGRLAARLDHPNIIKILDFGTHESFYYLCYEYFPGKNLREYWESAKPSEEEKISLLQQLIEGLVFVHKQEIIHRDIKPENIYVNADGELKIGDFGLALDLRQPETNGTNAIAGTPCYMSPEQIQGEELTIDSDLFSAGIVGLELFTGTNPLYAESFNDVVNRVLNFSIDNIEEELAYLPAEAEEMLRGLLSEHPLDRRKAIRKKFNVTPYANGKTPPDDKEPKKEPLFSGKLVFALIVLVAILYYVIWMNKTTSELQNIPNQNDTTSVTDTTTAPDTTAKHIEKRDTAREAPENTVLITDETREQGNDTESETENEPQITNKTGNVTISCIPWADIYLDGNFYDTTPLKKDIELPEGTHSIKLKHPDFPDYKTELQVSSEENKHYNFNLDALFSEVEIHIFPWGNVFLDNRFVGQTPLSKKIYISQGVHNFRIENPNFRDTTIQINIQNGEKVTFSYDFELKAATVE